MTKKVLLVDDSSYVRRQLREAISSFDLDIFEVDNGAVALEILRSDKPFSIMICDINMPEMNGIELCKNIQMEDLSPEMFILMLTTEANPETKEIAKGYGVKAWITKPFNPSTLQGIIQKILSQKISA